jgi:hypothetical protein
LWIFFKDFKHNFIIKIIKKYYCNNRIQHILIIITMIKIQLINIYWSTIKRKLKIIYQISHLNWNFGPFLLCKYLRSFYFGPNLAGGGFGANPGISKKSLFAGI